MKLRDPRGDAADDPLAGAALVELAGERVHLLAERALWWPRAATLIVADLHWGKAATFRAAGFPIPGGSTAGDLARLSRLIAGIGAARLVVLGDMWHARRGRTRAVESALVAWREGHPDLAMLLVRGNHDRHAGDPAARLGIIAVEEPYQLAPFSLAHHPDLPTPGYRLAGHLHPAVRLRGPGRTRARLPCFVVGQGGAVLPAFGTFTGSADITPIAGTALFAVAGDQVVQVSG